MNTKAEVNAVLASGKMAVNILVAIAYKQNEQGISKKIGARPEVRTVKRRLLNGLVEDERGEVWEWDLNKDGKFPQALINAVS